MVNIVESEHALMDPPWPADCEAVPPMCYQGQLWMIHGISHGIGLEVHDPAGFYDVAGCTPRATCSRSSRGAM